MKSSPRLSAIAVLTLNPAACLLAGPTGEAATTPAPVGDVGWWFHSTSYAWLTAQKGDMRIGALSVPVDVSFSDAINSIDEIDMAFMGGLEAGRGRWSIGVDLTYTNFSDDFAGDGNVFDSFRLEQTNWMINPFVSCQLVKEQGWHLDAILGARINIIEMDITGRFVGDRHITVGGSRDWVDPIVGLRGSWDLTDRLLFGVRGDIGGFGASSNFTWQAYVGLGWKVTRRSTLALGYRGLGTDYSKRGFGSDIVTHGPLLGLQITF